MKVVIPVVVVLLALSVTPVCRAGNGGRTPVVCIDPGHGGEDPGAVCNDVEEKVVNLEISLRIRPLIEAMGYKVVMTRTTDVTLSLQERCDIANNARADIFVSVHNNAYMTTSEGTETFCYYDSEEGRRLATLIHNQVVKRIQLTNRGVKEAGFYVLKNTDMPAALLEGAFITNPEEAEFLQDPEFQQEIAEGVAEGVHKYLIDPGRFDTYILLMNPDEEETAEVEMVYMSGDGKEECWEEEVPPGCRVTVHVDDYAVNSDVSTLVRSSNGVPIVAERTVYFNFDRASGGHGAPGVLSASTEWHLAEGSTDWGYSTFVLIQNPGKDENPVTLRFMRSDGHNHTCDYTLEPHSRFTLDVSEVPGFEEADFSVKVEAELPVVVERAMYWNDGNGYSGGHDSPGVAEPNQCWYLAEGYTGPGFDTFVLIENPNPQKARVTMEYMLPDGGLLTECYSLLPYSRRTVQLNEVVGLEDTDVSVRVNSDRPVVVERSMYFDYFGIEEGSNSTATTSLGKTWYVAEGYTGEGFDTYILLMNPGDVNAGTTLRFLLPGGGEKKVSVKVPARSRRTVKVNDIEGMDGREFSTLVSSGQPIVVERAVYFRIRSRDGGHSAVGVAAPAIEWYFAEGCTR
jgi:N-acetylmuramoyl-L-alanine amidase CwlD